VHGEYKNFKKKKDELLPGGKITGQEKKGFSL
jgi:hypothetical protein